MDDDRTLAELAAQPLDDVDAATLEQVRALYDATDPVPDDLVERIHFSLALDEMFDEVARMTRVPLDAMAVRGEQATGTRTETLTFSADRLTAMVTVSAGRARTAAARRLAGPAGGVPRPDPDPGRCRARGARRRAGPVQLRPAGGGFRPAQLPPGRRRRAGECGRDTPVPAVDSRRWPPPSTRTRCAPRSRRPVQESQQGRPARAVTRYRSLRSLHRAFRRPARRGGPAAGPGGARAGRRGVRADRPARRGDDAARRGRVARRRRPAPSRCGRPCAASAGCSCCAAVAGTEALRALDRAVEVMADADRVRPVLDPAQPRRAAPRRRLAGRRLRRLHPSASRSRSAPATCSTRPRPGTTSGTSTSWPAASRGRWPPWRRPPRGPRTSTRCCCWTGPGCCARRAWPRTPTAPGPGGRPSSGRRACTQDLAETDLVRAECALVEGEAGPGPAAGPGRRADLRAPGQRAVAAQGPAAGAAVRAAGPRGPARPTAAVPRCDGSRSGPARSPRTAGRRSGSTWPGPPSCSPASACCARAATLDEAGHAAPAMRASDPLPSRLLTREVRALAALHRGDLTRAAAEVRRGLAELGSYQNGFGSLDLRTACAVHGLPLARLGLELAERNDSPAEFFAAVERGRAISDPAGQRRARRRTSAPPSCSRPCGRPRRRRAASRATRRPPRSWPGCAPGPASLQRDIRARAWELEGGDAGDPVSRTAPGIGGDAGRRPSARAPRSSPTSCTAAGGPAVLASGPPAAAVRPGRRGGGRRARPARPRRPGRPGDAVPAAAARRWRCGAPSTPGCAVSTTCSSPRSASRDSRSSSPAAQPWCCCPGACCRRGAGSPSW